MKKVPLFCFLAATLLAGCANHRFTDIGDWKVRRSDPISAVGHGGVFDAQGRQFEASPNFVLGAQRYYLKRLYQQADREQRARFQEKQRSIEGEKARTKTERILVNAALVNWLIETVQPQDRAHLASKNTALLSRFVQIKDGVLSDKESGTPPLNKNLVALLWREGALSFLATQAGGPAYIEECRKAGVPIPPDWGSPNWKFLGKLGTKFISAGIDAELFSFETQAPRGTCFALPRSSGNTISLLGMICLGTDTSNSCFWDNQKNKMQFDIPKNTAVPLSDFAGGADLFTGTGGVCTDCHAGENPFIVHPGQPMDINGLLPKSWPDPLVHPAWPQNQGPTNALTGIVLNPGEDSCISCHGKPPGRRFPQVSTATPGYCSIILPKAIQFTMPPGSPGNNASYAKQKAALLASCDDPPPGGVVVNGATQTEPTSDKTDITGDLSSCAGGPDCPVGFCYWRTIHGPFWQKTPSNIPIGDANYRGSFARIFIEGNKWRYRVFSDPTGPPPNAPPGGTLECTNYNDIVTVPDENGCFTKQFAVFDPDGSNSFQSVDATLAGTTANVLSGFIGNVAQATVDRRPDTLRVFEGMGKVLLEQSHHLTPPAPLKPGPLSGESFTNGCSGWTPLFDAKDIFTNSDVQLVSSAQADKVRCYITGIAGAWSSTRDDAKVQPFAEIYKGSGNDIRLRVSPTDGADRVGAWGSCIRIK